jgi:hypothetical protein
MPRAKWQLDSVGKVLGINADRRISLLIRIKGRQNQSHLPHVRDIVIPGKCTRGQVRIVIGIQTLFEGSSLLGFSSTSI